MLNKILQIFVTASIVIGLVLALLTVLDFDEKICTDCWPFENLIVYCYVLIAVLVLVALGGAGMGLMKKPESLKMMLIGVGGTVLLFGISYGMASDEVTADMGNTVSAGMAKLIDTGLIAMYITMFLSICTVAFSSVMKIVRR
ncbi:MAG: hypothetical protein JKY42_12050 [Flavobacteriales bacterium]|nr:hypothetical protein [Flavobacteriales bacterium]